MRYVASTLPVDCPLHGEPVTVDSVAYDEDLVTVLDRHLTCGCVLPASTWALRLARGERARFEKRTT